MIDVVNRKCEHEGCSTQPSYNLPNEKKGRFCKKHAKEGMINVVENRKCQTHLCEIRVDNDKYKGYCLRCFIYMFPEEPITRNYKTKEYEVVNHICSIYKNDNWIHDKRIHQGCSKRRPDLFLDLVDQIIIVEIDENQHEKYDCSCENKRLMELSLDVGHCPIIFIRFNPDEYYQSNNKLIPSCWTYDKQGLLTIKKSKQKEWKNRLDCLIKTIDYWIHHKTNKTIEIIQLYFDENI
jgi:hypothetical protein